MTEWRDVRDATRFGPACQQPSAPPGSIYAEIYPAMSEDCPSLNIWAPAGSKNAPVLGTIDRITAVWPKIPDTGVERDLSNAMVDYWASFARSGVPTAHNPPAWPSHNDGADYTIFAGKPRVAADLMPKQYELHEEVVRRRRAAGDIPWNWNVGVTSPILPPAQGTRR
jgi:para-nitrobenzyl esterase